VLDAMMPEYGDVNRDGFVDQADAAILAANFGRTGDASWEHGNFDLPYRNDRAVTLANLAQLQANLSLAASAVSSAASAANTPVPEPSTLVLVGAAIALLPVSRRSKVAFRSAKERV
jgi:hypothetical protein